MNKEILIASDHGGFNLKECVKELLKERGIDALDLGPETTESVDYPDFAHKVASLISENKYERGILVCGTGIGMSIVSNRYPGVRGTLCHNAFTAKMAREHNNSNLLIMGERVLEQNDAREIVSLWLDTKFEGGRHLRRVDKIEPKEK